MTPMDNTDPAATDDTDPAATDDESNDTLKLYYQFWVHLVCVHLGPGSISRTLVILRHQRIRTISRRKKTRSSQ